MDAPTTATATPKRKRTAGADIAAQAVEEATDAEVEEFYAILRRMRDASRRYVSGTGAGAGAGTVAGAGARAPAARAPAWCPSFSWEDFAPPAAAPVPAVAAPARLQPVDERVTENATPRRRPAGVCLDLNAEPEPEAPATPRAERVSA
uniref:Uncharacterized protein n=1 Tax=Avena sativa TaxID=4498 RepID=A0ACD5TQX4_AVESA